MTDEHPRMNNSGEGQLVVPGYGLPLNYSLDVEDEYYLTSDIEGPFRHGVYDYASVRLTAKEISMLQFMNAITDKPKWDEKVFDEEIVTKWRTEVHGNFLMTDAAVDWCIRELRDKASLYRQSKYVTTFDNDTVFVKSDNLINETTRQELKAAVAPLIEVDAAQKDWHPNSNEQVLNLVHPSLFPLVYGRSQILSSGLVGTENCLDTIGTGEVLPEVKLPDFSPYDGNVPAEVSWSTNFQWLPCEVKFQEASDTNVKITSYINNLHPIKHKDLYPVIEKFISASIKPWNEVLIKGDNGRNPPRIFTLGADINEVVSLPDWVDQLEDDTFDGNLAQCIDQAHGFIQMPNHYSMGPQQDVDDDLKLELDANPDGWELADIMRRKHRLLNEIEHPDPGMSSTYEEWKLGKGPKAVVGNYSNDHTFYRGDYEKYTVNLEKEFRDRGLQVIVKLAGIELTPEKPDYSGGNWHLEGMLNEHIVATSIYYYDVENVTEASIRFRQQAELDEENLNYEQGQFEHLCAIFGAANLDQERAVQELGNITTPQGRLIAFSNVSQHRVEPFSLADKDRPGHRRFLLLWLVDPHLRVMSTANVPPQQQEWWADEYLKVAGGRLPSEINQMIVDTNSNNLMTRSEAEEIRLKLMAERTNFGDKVEISMGTYNLCEH